MSLYSGFVSSKYENFYDRLTFKLIELLQDHVIKTIGMEDYALCKKVLKIQKGLQKLEESRHNHNKENNISSSFSNLAKLVREICQSSCQASNTSVIESKRSNPVSE
jgi:hypothetical protein